MSDTSQDEMPGDSPGEESDRRRERRRERRRARRDRRHREHEDRVTKKTVGAGIIDPWNMWLNLFRDRPWFAKATIGIGLVLLVLMVLWLLL